MTNEATAIPSVLEEETQQLIKEMQESMSSDKEVVIPVPVQAEEEPKVDTIPIVVEESIPKEVTPTPAVKSENGLKLTPIDDDNGSELDKANHRYDVLKGRLDKQTADLTAQNKELLERNEQLAAQMTAHKSVDLSDMSSLTDEEIISIVGETSAESEGMDFWRKNEKLQQAIILKGNKAQTAPDPRLEKLLKDNKKSASNMFYDAVEGKVPNIKEITNSREFATFRNKIDPKTGLSNNTLLGNAEDELDVHRTVAILSEFITSFNPTQSPVDVMPTQTLGTAPPTTASKMPASEWNRQFEALVTRGLSPTEIASEQKKLMALQKEGLINYDL